MCPCIRVRGIRDKNNIYLNRHRTYVRAPLRTMSREPWMNRGCIGKGNVHWWQHSQRSHAHTHRCERINTYAHMNIITLCMRVRVVCVSMCVMRVVNRTAPPAFVFGERA